MENLERFVIGRLPRHHGISISGFPKSGNAEMSGNDTGRYFLRIVSRISSMIFFSGLSSGWGEGLLLSGA